MTAGVVSPTLPLIANQGWGRVEVLVEDRYGVANTIHYRYSEDGEVICEFTLRCEVGEAWGKYVDALTEDWEIESVDLEEAPWAVDVLMNPSVLKKGGVPCV